MNADLVCPPGFEAAFDQGCRDSAAGERFDSAGRRVNAFEIGATMFGDVNEERALIFTPNHAAARAAAW